MALGRLTQHPSGGHALPEYHFTVSKIEYSSNLRVSEDRIGRTEISAIEDSSNLRVSAGRNERMDVSARFRGQVSRIGWIFSSLLRHACEPLAQRCFLKTHYMYALSRLHNIHVCFECSWNFLGGGRLWVGGKPSFSLLLLLSVCLFLIMVVWIICYRAIGACICLANVTSCLPNLLFRLFQGQMAQIVHRGLCIWFLKSCLCGKRGLQARRRPRTNHFHLVAQLSWPTDISPWVSETYAHVNTLGTFQQK